MFNHSAFLTRFLAFAALMALAACGNLPQPFAGNPGTTALRLAQPPPARLVVVPPDQQIMASPAGTGFASDIAAALVDRDVPAFAEMPHAGDWRLVIGVQPEIGGIVPTFTVQNPAGIAQGTAEGSPLDASSLNAVSSPVLHQTITDAASKVAALLTRIEAQRQLSDPNSLRNRPAKVAFSGVSGAPGDGNTALARQFRADMTLVGEPLQEGSVDADFTVLGRVIVTPTAGNREQVEIQWIVHDAKGGEAGKVSQLNEIPAGTLDHYWGDVAVVVAQEAAGGVRDVIVNQTGARGAALSGAQTGTPAGAQAGAIH